MKISDTTKRQARNICRIASVLSVLVTMNACGMIRDAIDGKDGTNNGQSSNGNDTSSKASTTNAQALAASAQQAKDPLTQSYVTSCQKNAACKDDADKVGTLIQQAIQEINSQQDATATLTDFETALTTLIQCVKDNPPTDGTAAPVAPTKPTQDSNDKTCSSSTDPNGTTQTKCKSTQQTCVTLEQPDGYTVETCVTGKGDTSGNPASNPNSMPSENPNSNPSANPNSMPSENPNVPPVATNPNGTKGTTEKCTASAQSDGSMSVTCTCNTVAGTCNVQTTSP